MNRYLLLAVLVTGMVAVGCGQESPKPAKTASAESGPKLVAANEKPSAPASEATNAAKASDSSDGGKVHEQLPTDKIVKAAEPAPTEEVLLGTADLTHGIPGKGPLKKDEIKKWLDD